MHEGLKNNLIFHGTSEACEKKAVSLCKNIDKHGLKGQERFTKKLTCSCDDCERFAIKIFLYLYSFHKESG